MCRFLYSWRYALLACLVLVATAVAEYRLLRRPKLAGHAVNQPIPEEADPDLSGPFWDKCRLVKSGMTVAQVRAILGPPLASGQANDFGVVWWEDDRGNRCSLLFGGSIEDGYALDRTFHPKGEEPRRMTSLPHD